MRNPVRGRMARDSQTQLIAQLVGFFTRSPEARLWLKHYSIHGGDRFAVIRVSGDVLHDPMLLSQVSSSLAFLYRMGLYPVVVHGAGLFTGKQSETIREAMSPLQHALETGNRPTPEEVELAWDVAQRYMVAVNASLVDALEGLGVDAVALPESGFSFVDDGKHVGTEDDGVWGLLGGGGSFSVNTDVIEGIIAEGALPIVAAMGRSADGEEVRTFSTRDATKSLVDALNPMKVIVLRPEGALRVRKSKDEPRAAGEVREEEGGDGIEALKRVFVRTDKERIRQEIVPEDATLWKEVEALFEGGIDAGSTVAITAPSRLADELFSLRGGGTLVLEGEPILHYTSLDDVPSLPQLADLLEASFQKPLPPSFFTEIKPMVKSILVAESGRGCAIVTNRQVTLSPGRKESLAYLDKFAVHPAAQGEELGERLYEALVQAEPKLFWRSRSENRINPWYFQRADGAYKQSVHPRKWTVFWRNIPDDTILPAIQAAIDIPPTFS